MIEADRWPVGRCHPESQLHRPTLPRPRRHGFEERGAHAPSARSRFHEHPDDLGSRLGPVVHTARRDADPPVSVLGDERHPALARRSPRGPLLPDRIGERLFPLERGAECRGRVGQGVKAQRAQSPALMSSDPANEGGHADSAASTSGRRSGARRSTPRGFETPRDSRGGVRRSGARISRSAHLRRRFCRRYARQGLQ